MLNKVLLLWGGGGGGRGEGHFFSLISKHLIGEEKLVCSVQTLTCGSDMSKDVLKQLSHISQKLNVLEKKVDSLSSRESGPCGRGKNAFLY